MGCFDTLYMNCPWCQKETWDQIKPGYMNSFRFGDDWRTDIQFKGIYKCMECKKDFIIDFETPPKMIVKKLED